MARTSAELPLHIPAGRCRRTEPCCAQQCPVQARDFRQKEWLCDSISVLPVCSENRKAWLQPGWVSSAPFPPAVDLAESKQTWHTLLKCQGPCSQAPQHCHRALLLSPCCGGIQSPAPNAAAAHQPHGPPVSGAKPCNAECSSEKMKHWKASNWFVSAATKVPQSLLSCSHKSSYLYLFAEGINPI